MSVHVLAPLGISQWLATRGVVVFATPTAAKKQGTTMSIYSTNHVLPRPVEPLPDYPHAKARQTLAERLVAAFAMSGEAANAIANAVVDPSDVRKSIGEPSEPQTEEIAVPGGKLLGIRTEVWARAIMPDPRNPRIGPSRKHPFAVMPGTAGEDSRFRPVPEPKSPPGRENAPELIVDVESRDHLAWASTQAAKYVLAENDWRDSIASQGVMEAVWLAATTYRHADGSDSVTALTTVEGSSRGTAVHDLLGVRSADVPYGGNDVKIRAEVRKLNETFERGATGDEMVALRCERIPALIIVGFRKHDGVTTGFPTAVKSLVALRHVDPPKPWGEGPENEALADEILDELFRRGLISETERAYLAGACTREEARAAHLPDDAARRAARIVGLFTGSDDRVDAAIRVAVTSQSTRKRITPKLKNALATALILRALDDDADRADRARRYMRHAFGKAAHQRVWESTNRDTEVLVAEALREVSKSIANGDIAEPGPASLELAVRSAYPLIVKGQLAADRGSANNDQPDRRTPGELLDAMRRSIGGVHQLGQALRDFEANQPVRAVDEHGQVRRLSDGAGDQSVTDVYLRDEFPPKGKVRAKRGGLTPAEILRERLADLSNALEQVDVAHGAVIAVRGADGRSVAEADGVDPQLCAAWRETLNRINDDLIVWGRKFQQRYGIAAQQVQAENGLDDSLEDQDQSDDADEYESSPDEWDNTLEDSESERT
jgi:hypothetical protein